MSRTRTHAAWSEADHTLLVALYANTPSQELAALLNRPIGSVYGRAAEFGIKKSAEFMASTKAGRIQRGRTDERMISGQFAAGQIPWNKGLHYVAGGKAPSTQFKPGNKPHTWKPVGSYRVTGDGVLEKKTNCLPGANHVRWKPVARLVWEAAHGPIAEGMLIVFKPGCKTVIESEITPDKLECISRATNAQRNHPRNSSPEMGKIYQLRGAITRQINRIYKESQAA